MNNEFEKIEDVINEKGVFFSKTKGVSMRPFIVEGRDTVEYVKPKGELKKYDMALYKRKDGKYCMHRVIKVRKDDYYIIGDNTTTKEYVKKADIIAVATGYYKDLKYVDCNTNKRYKFCVRLWCLCVPLRTFILKSINTLKRLAYPVYKKLFKRKDIDG